MQLGPLLLFDGQCEEAFRVYEKYLNGKVEAIMPFEGTPAARQVPAEWRKKIIHARMAVGDQILMGSDAPPGRYQKPQGFFVSLQVAKPDEVEQIFQELAENGRILMPVQQTFWAARFGMVIDRFGIPWSVNCEHEK